MTTYNELTGVEGPLLQYLKKELNYTLLSKEEAIELRGGPQQKSQVFLKLHLVKAIQELNDLDEDTARSIASDLMRKVDNEEWLSLLRGNFSKLLPGEKTHRTIRLIDFDNPENNSFVVTSQFVVHGKSHAIPDVVVFVNGIPLVVIEAKSAIAKQDVFDAIDDIAVYEQQLPRLFQTNLFNIATNGTSLRYGATGSPKAFWSVWRDPWPQASADFDDDPMRQGLWALLHKERLLDLLAHFVVFEKDPDTGAVQKKICRYQQLRAVNKMVDRVAEGEHKRGLIWHTQGSGKSLTMVFGALKLKFHYGLSSPHLENPNIMVVVDRKDLDDQITKTFQSCGIPNVEHADGIEDLQEKIKGSPKGKVLISTIHKIQGSSQAIDNSEDWIILVDEAHRTQERDLGAYLRLTFPDACLFGFTGTPVKTKDLDTRKNFSVKGEDYLDRYAIEDAVADGATVPIKYMSRMALWDLDDAKLDVLFDQQFATLSEELRNMLKARGVTKGDLSRFEPRIQLIAYDIWTHFKTNVQPDNHKAQIVAVDRRACTIYKRALDAVIADDLEAEGITRAEAETRAADMSACVYSSDGKNDKKEGNEDLLEFYLDEAAEKQAKQNFKDPDHPLSFLIVCNKLLTGFDAPVEQAMYLDSDLKEHNLLQAIARTNRRFGSVKDHGIIVDYVGVTKSLKDALGSYEPEDVKDAMGSDEELVAELKAAHKAVMAFLAKAKRTGEPEKDAKAGVAAISGEDEWYDFRTASAAFLRAHAAVGSSPERLKYNADIKYVASVVAYGKLKYEQELEVDFKGYSEKIRGMLKEHLEVTGLKTVLSLPSLTDPAFWLSPAEDEDIETAALKKATALKKTLVQKASQNPAQYEKLSQRVRDLINRFLLKQITAAELYKETMRVSADAVRKSVEYQRTGLDEETYGIWSILNRGAGSDAKHDVQSQFSRRALAEIEHRYADWTHENCDDTADHFCLGAKSGRSIEDIVRLLERLVDAPMPDGIDDDEDDYSELAHRIVGAPERLLRAKDPYHPDLGPWIGWTILGTEPLLFKLMAYVSPDAAKKLAEKRSGLATIVAALQKEKRIPYTLKLKDDEFKSPEGWPSRSAYDNAIRSVMGIRISTSHKAPKVEPHDWERALAVVFGVVEMNYDDLVAALDEPDEVEDERAEDIALDDLSDTPNAVAAKEIRNLYDDEQLAHVNWHRNKQSVKNVKSAMKKVLMKLPLDKAERDGLLAELSKHGTDTFARVKDD